MENIAVMSDPLFNKKPFVFCLCDDFEDSFVLLYEGTNLFSVSVPEKFMFRHHSTSGRSSYL
jgi:hypothetical protein